MRCIVWAAVSTARQAYERAEDAESEEEPEFSKESIPSQIDDARELIQRTEGWHEVHDPLIVPGHSRSYIFLAEAARDMPVYTELMELTRSGSIDLLICRGRDRLGRKDALIAQVEEYLASYEVQVYSMAMPTRIQDPTEFRERKDRASIWMRSVERAKAQDEVTELQQRFQMGMRGRIRKKGLHANKIPYGYRLGPEDYGVIYGAESEIVGKIFEWFLEGKTYSDMHDLLPAYAQERYPKHNNHIKYIVENPYYAGLVAFRRFDSKEGGFRDPSDWIMAEGQHEGIVSKETWDAAQREMAARMDQARRQRYNTYPLSGFVICAYCSRRMTVSPGGPPKGVHRYQYYHCRYKDCQRPSRRNSVRLDRLEPVVLEWLIERATDRQLLNEDLEKLSEATGNATAEDIAKLERTQNRTMGALEQWRRDYEDQLISRSEYYTHRNRLLDQLEMVQSELQEKQAAIERLDPERISEQLEKIVGDSIEAFRQAWGERSNVKELKALFRQIGLRIMIAEDAHTTEIAP